MTSNTPASAHTLGSLRSADGTGIVRIEDRCSSDIGEVWSALTDPPRLARWYGEVTGDMRLGGEYRAPGFFASEWDGTGRVEACEPQRRLDLGAHLGGRERCDASARFAELFPAYQELAANVGWALSAAGRPRAGEPAGRR